MTCIIMCILVVLVISGIAFLVILHYAGKIRTMAQERDGLENIFQQQLLNARLEMQDQTFKAVSQEIHDNVGQILSLAKVHLNVLTFGKGDDDPLNLVKTLLNEAVLSLRNLVSGYYAEGILSDGLPAAIQFQLHLLEKTGMYTTSFHTDVPADCLHLNSNIILYRIVQEALNNVLKHAAASHVEVAVVKNGERMRITIKDNGIGFNTGASGRQAGIGLKGIHQRAGQIGASANIISSTGKGTTVEIIF